MALVSTMPPTPATKVVCYYYAPAYGPMYSSPLNPNRNSSRNSSSNSSSCYCCCRDHNTAASQEKPRRATTAAAGDSKPSPPASHRSGRQIRFARRPDTSLSLSRRLLGQKADAAFRMQQNKHAVLKMCGGGGGGGGGKNNDGSSSSNHHSPGRGKKQRELLSPAAFASAEADGEDDHRRDLRVKMAATTTAIITSNTNTMPVEGDVGLATTDPVMHNHDSSHSPSDANHLLGGGGGGSLVAFSPRHLPRHLAHPRHYRHYYHHSLSRHPQRRQAGGRGPRGGNRGPRIVRHVTLALGLLCVFGLIQVLHTVRSILWRPFWTLWW